MLSTEVKLTMKLQLIIQNTLAFKVASQLKISLNLNIVRFQSRSNSHV